MSKPHEMPFIKIPNSGERVRGSVWLLLSNGIMQSTLLRPIAFRTRVEGRPEDACGLGMKGISQRFLKWGVKDHDE